MKEHTRSEKDDTVWYIGMFVCV